MECVRRYHLLCPIPFCAPVTEYLRIYKEANFTGLQFWRLKGLRSRSSRVGLWWGHSFPPQCCCILWRRRALDSHTADSRKTKSSRVIPLLQSSFIMTLFKREELLKTSQYRPPPDTITVAIRFPAHEFWQKHSSHRTKHLLVMGMTGRLPVLSKTDHILRGNLNSSNKNRPYCHCWDPPWNTTQLLSKPSSHFGVSFLHWETFSKIQKANILEVGLLK